MSDYMVKIRIPKNIEIEEYVFETSYYSDESFNLNNFKNALFEGEWRIGFNQSDWGNADKVWIFLLVAEVYK